MTTLEQHWRTFTWVSALLLLPSLVFRLLVYVRRVCYKVGFFNSKKSTIPVVVIGNITAGGTGKSPTVSALALLLLKHGYRPGIVSRGFGGTACSTPTLITEKTDVAQVGDEPYLHFLKTGVSVVVDKNRPAAIQFIQEKTPCNIVLSDDGLQHYPMARDIEIATIDGECELGNRLLHPAGPLREPASRLKSVDFVISKNKSSYTNDSFSLKPLRFVSTSDNAITLDLNAFSGSEIHAVAAIARPQSFFDSLRKYDIKVIEHAFPDHYFFSKSDLAFGDSIPIVMTEKDAVKITYFNISNAWVMQVGVEFHSDFSQRLLDRIKSLNNAQSTDV
ncbi:MAG: tetraacyldisaccharide 4'-kinase [Pseudomonadota bacterium]